jgi:hypothetical protein
MFALIFTIAALAAGTDTLAQSWPTRPIRMINRSPRAAAMDIQARLFSTNLPALGQTVIVESRLAVAAISARNWWRKRCQTATRFCSIGLAVNQTLYRKLNYSAVRDLAPVLLVSSTPLILVLHPSVPAKNVKELVALAKARPGQFNFGSNSTGSTSHLAAEQMKTMSGVTMTHIPYKGSGQATIALLGGEIDLLFSTMPPAVQHVRTEKCVDSRSPRSNARRRCPTPTMDDTQKVEMDTLAACFPGQLTHHHALPGRNDESAEGQGCALVDERTVEPLAAHWRNLPLTSNARSTRQKSDTGVSAQVD